MGTLTENVKLIISEPLENFMEIKGVIKKTLHTSDGEKYLLIEDLVSHGLYIVSSRHKESDIDDLFLGKLIIIGVAKPKTYNINFDDPNFIKYLTNFGIGSIELSK